MTYSLAKKLKDAGFPGMSIGLGHDCPGCSCSNADPTLEELISVCGDRFYSLVKRNGFWEAYYTLGLGHEFDGKVTGSTPSEAVARLWLALNKKDG